MRTATVAASVVASAMPLGFGVIRAATTGNDFRYVWVALGSVAGAAVAMLIGRGFATRPIRAVAALTLGVFLAATVFAMATAMLLGTSFNLGMLIVAASFGVCLAAGAALSVFARTRS